MRYYCTYFDRNYLARGLALIDSLQRHEREPHVVIVVCLDEMTRLVLAKLALPSVRLVPLSQLEQRDYPLLATKASRTVVEYYWTLTPTIILRLLEREPDIDVLTYLDADLFFFSAPQPIFDELGRSSILIHEHRYSPAQAGLASSNGRFNVGLLSFRRDPQGFEALRWWRERCLEWCFARYEDGKMGDQLYLQDWPTRFSGVTVLQHPGGGVAPWNHDQYRHQQTAEGAPCVDGQPVIFYHFHSLKLKHPDVVVPTGHPHYPLPPASLAHCFVPYADALGEAYRRMIQVDAEATWGIDPALPISSATTLLARNGLRERLAALAASHRCTSATDAWDVYAPAQGQAAKPHPVQASASVVSPSKARSIPVSPAIASVSSAVRKDVSMQPVPMQHDLLSSLRGTAVAQQVRTLYVGGAHRYQERALFDQLFPHLEAIYLFEPIPELAAMLRTMAAQDRRITVFPYALSNENGTRDFFLTNNDGESSSLLRLGKHKEIFPHVHEVRSVPVTCRTLDSVIQEAGLRAPDMLLLDVQGAEYQIVSSLSASVREHLSVLYVEASLEEVYQGARCLEDLKTVLATDLDLMAFAPLGPSSPTHGNALFLNRRLRAAVSKPQSQPRAVVQGKPDDPLISVIVSSYAAEAFMRECLTDLEGQTIVDRCEIIVVDAASPEQEGAIALEFQRRYGNVTYVRTPMRIGVYPAWNMAIRLARGRYITPFSTNDRLNPEAYAQMVAALEAHPDVALVYGDSYLTDLPHQTFLQHHRVGTWAWPTYNYQQLLHECMIGPHPMWRRAVHETVGYFDESYVALGDQDFWIRIGATHAMMHIPVVTGLYWKSPDGLSNRPALTTPEEQRLRATYAAKRVSINHPPTAKQDPAVSKAVSAAATFDCSIIIPVWNNLALTQQCVSKLAEVTDGATFEVIAVDNGSTDGVQDFLRTLGGDVTVIRNEDNLGFAKACNQGAQAARGEYLVFLNNDTVPLKGWLSALVEEVRAHADVAVVGSRLLYEDGTIQHAGVVFARCGVQPYHAYRGFQRTLTCVSRRREYQCVTAACMLVRRAVFHQVAGFDEGYQNGFEDVDLCLKIRERGGKIVYQPKSTLYHLESKTPGRKAKEDENARYYQSRWADHWWLSDEDAMAYEDGLWLQTVWSGPQSTCHYKVIEDATSHTRAELVAEAQRAAQRRDVAAVKVALRRIAEWPDDSRILDWGASLCLVVEEPLLWLEFAKRSLATKEVPSAHVTLAKHYMDQGDLDQAERHITRALTLEPSHGDALLLHGILLMQRQAYADAEAACERALICGADQRKARLGLIMAAMGGGHGERAWTEAMRLCEQLPDDEEAAHWLLRTGTALERWDALAQRLATFVARNPASLAMRFARAGVLLRAVRRADAQRECDALRALDPQFEGLAELTRRIAESGPVGGELRAA